MVKCTSPLASPPGCILVTLGVYDNKSIRDFKLSVADLDAVTQCQNGRLVGFGTSTSALASSTEASTAESTSSGIFSGEESTTADIAVPAEFNSLTSDEPSSNIPETSGSEAPITA